MPHTPIDLATWPRRDHYHLFRSLDNPYFSVTVALDVTDWRRAITAAGLPFYPSLVHQVMTAANGLEAFRLRIRGEEVVLHDVVHPSFTVPWGEDLFNFCIVDYEPDLAGFVARAKATMAEVQAAEGLLLDPPGKDDMIFISCLPWLAFTGLSQVADGRSGDSFPRIVWGKLARVGDRETVPLQVQLHHALADGLHIGRFVERLESVLAETAHRLGVAVD